MALPKGFTIIPFNDEPDKNVNTAAILFKEIAKIDKDKAPYFKEHKEPSRGSSCEFGNLNMEGYFSGDGYARLRVVAACHSDARGDFQHIFFNRWADEYVKEWRKPYIHWLANESPMAGIFLSKNPDMILKYGAITDARVYKGLAFAAAICSRSLHEHTSHASLWWPLVQAGVPPTVAYMIAMCHRVDGDDVWQNAVSHGGVDPYFWDAHAAKRWLGILPLIKEGKARRADGTFADGQRIEVREAFAAPTKVKEGRFGSSNVSVKDEWIQWQADNWVDNLKKLGIEVAQLGTFQQAAPTAPKKNLNEPEEDM